MDNKYEDDPQQYKTTGVAARVGDLMGLQQMVWNGRPVDVFDNRGWSPLHEAAHGGFSGCAEFLLRQPETDPDWRTHNNETATLIAARHGHSTCLRALINAQADINIATNEGFTPLYEAVRSRSPDCIRLLVKKGADLNCKAYTGYTALHQAAIMGRSQIVSYLLQQGARQDVQCCNGLTPLFMAVQSGNTDTVRVFLKHGAANAKDLKKDVVNLPAYDNATPLLIAAQEGHSDIVDLLLDHGADANIQVTETRAGPLQYAIYCGYEKCVASLIPVTDMQLFANDYGLMHPIVQAIKWPTTTMLKSLMDADLDPFDTRGMDGTQRTELRIREGLPERFGKGCVLCHIPGTAPLVCARYLLDHGLSANGGQANGCEANGHELPPLIAAMIRGHHPLLCLLLEYGAKPNIYFDHVGGNVAMLYALHYDLQFWSDFGENEDEEGKESAAMANSFTKDNGNSSGVNQWLSQRKQSYLFRLFAAGGEVGSLFRENGEGGLKQWGLSQMLLNDLNVNDNEGKNEKSMLRMTAVLALLLCLSHNVESLPSALLKLVSADQAKELNTIAGRTNTLAQLCRHHIFRRLFMHEDNLEKGVASLGLPQTVCDYLLFPELAPYGRTLSTLLAQKPEEE
ncbi:ankyrin repeat and SOCS box protein 2-like [Littorina saxatilis]|uniref:Ankyrin repeat protein n=1 Tax=Littorina saxatilis TaxID=31220 RepID=A0AAN9BF99_9CAEN